MILFTISAAHVHSFLTGSADNKDVAGDRKARKHSAESTYGSSPWDVGKSGTFAVGLDVIEYILQQKYVLRAKP